MNRDKYLLAFAVVVIGLLLATTALPIVAGVVTTGPGLVILAVAALGVWLWKRRKAG
ncbi:MAG TPA: hypothetical protein VK445_05930 [Dissulfurispiraceae bacterium]|nr:hypothetical protein [Dissulfurispiraceae bacterium]